MCIYEEEYKTMLDRNYLDQLVIAASKKVKEREYWLKKLSGEIVKCTFPYDSSEKTTGKPMKKCFKFELTGELFPKLMALSNGSLQTLYVILTTGLVLLLQKYTGRKDIMVGSPIFKQNVKKKLINKVLVLRHLIEENMTFKELLLQVKQTLIEANENRNYPVEILPDQLGLSVLEPEENFPLFDIAILLENIHDKSDIQHIKTNITLSFSLMHGKGLQKNQTFSPVSLSSTANGASWVGGATPFLEDHGYIEGKWEFNSSRYREETIKRISTHFKAALERALLNLNLKVSDIDILIEQEKKQLLYEFNDTRRDYPGDKTIHEIFEEQVERTPDKVSLKGTSIVTNDPVTLTYKELNKRSNQLARLIRRKGVKPDTIVGIMVERSVEMIVSTLAILKAGGAYMPVDTEDPGKRVKYMLDDGNVPLLLTNNRVVNNYSFIELLGLQESGTNVKVTEQRKQMTDLDQELPIPDRSLISYERYGNHIGMAMAKNTIAIQASRGCPYKCLYCHKIWPKKHVFRSAEHIFDEVQLYYNMGVRRFVIVDDVFNLNKENSSKFFKLIIQNGLDLQLFFPNGMRGDILTKDYIDLMMEAGTVNLALALETASPRLQKLIRKDLDIDKLQKNMAYICETHPHVISELFTMHGFPTETANEAQMTMDFIKSLKWLHLPHVNILKIYPNTDMADLAIKHGVSPEAIARSENLAFHQLPETLPFDESFTVAYQTQYLDYFLSKERLLHVLPFQMKILTRDEIIQKYNSFLPTEINTVDDLLKLAGITREEFERLDPVSFLDDNCMKVPGLDKKMGHHFASIRPPKDKDAVRIFLTDLSQFFTGECEMLYDVSEPPLGLIYLLTYLNKVFGSKIEGKIAKSRTDYDSYAELKTLLEEFRPDIIGIRALTFFNQFFHKTVSAIRSWGFDVPIIAGGPYATSDYKRILQDTNVDLVVLGEGEITLSEIIERFIKNNNKIPGEEVLREIPGIAFVPGKEKRKSRYGREIILLDELSDLLAKDTGTELEHVGQPRNLAYTMFTSGSTGQPKAVMVEHQSVIRLVKNTNFITFKEEENLLQTAPLEFDASTFEIWGSLLNGLGYFLTREDTILNPEDLKECIGKYDISTMWMTAPLFNRILEADIETFSGLKRLIVGGDALSPFHINRLKSRFHQMKVINGYGPTENTTFSTTYLIDREYQGSIPIGKPIANSSVYILDKYNHLVPVGVVGELCLGGDGVSRGYLNNPELTEEKFDQDLQDLHDYQDEKGLKKRTGKCSFTPLPLYPSTSLYRTGDLARWLPDGNIEFFGREDHQVKIRGIRIELGEIENRLLRFDEIKDAVVVVKEDKDGDKNLYAYIVLKQAMDLSAIKNKLSEELPDYMLPLFFVQMDEIPLTPNGKVDRNVLPDPEIAAGDDYIAPRNDLERKLVDIWSHVLDLNKEVISIDSNFFDLGGHSLKATILTTEIHKELNVKVPIPEIFSAPTIVGLSEYILKESSGDQFVSIEKAEEKEFYKLSSVQRRLYFLQNVEPGNKSYNIPIIVRLEGNFESRKFYETFKRIIKRHEILRTSFVMINEEIVQRIDKNVDFEIKYYKMDEGSEPTALSSNLEIERIIDGFVHPFHLSKAPLLRVGILELDPGNRILMLDFHHIIFDGVSGGIFIREFLTLYNGGEVDPFRLQYKDYSEWQNREAQKQAIKSQQIYWFSVFSDGIPLLNLPTDYDRPKIKTYEGNHIYFEIGKEETQALNDLGTGEEATLFMVLLAIYNVFLYKITAQEDIVIGTSIACRRHADLSNIIGMFVNAVPMRNYPEGEKTFVEFLKEVKLSTLEAYENQDFQFEDLVKKVAVNREAGRNPLFDTMFVLNNENDDYININDAGDVADTHLPGLRIIPCKSENNAAQMDLKLRAVESADHLLMSFEYSTKLFKAETIEIFVKNFKKIVSSIIKEKNIVLSRIEIAYDLIRLDSTILEEDEGDFNFGSDSLI
jgi:amino acid adenylation domain-containing protein